MKGTHFRQMLCLLLALVLTGALFGCGRAVPASEEAAAVPGFFLTAEYDRLYYAPLDGSAPRLLVDNSTVCTVRTGEWLYASFEDGSVRRLSLDGSQMEELVPAGVHVYRQLIPYDGGFVGIWYSLRDGSGCDLYRDGSQTPVPFVADNPVFSSYAAGRYMYSSRYEGERGDQLVAYDTENLEAAWMVPVESNPEILRDEQGLLCFVPNSGTMFRIDEDAQNLIPVDLPLAQTDCELIVSHGGTCLVQGNYSDNYRYWLVSKDGRRLMNDSLPEYFSLMDIIDSKALLYSRSGGESAAGENTWYTQDCFMVIDLESGEVSEFPVQGQYGALFSGGDFPTMDSSTARKPVTSDIYAFFCESTGAGGTVPLCSTTHGAWLNIADGGADLALLAAPTQEEQDYLDERGVKVEMKLYGGDGLVFIGNRACGVENLSLEQVCDIYRGHITNWKQLGGADHAIRVLYRDDQSGSQRLFERMLWKDESVPDFEHLGFDRLDDMSSIVSECLRDPYAIGYSIMTYLNDVFSKEELLAFSLEGYAATPENVAARNYPLGTQGYVVIRSDEPENSPARRLFDWFGSPLSDVILTRNGVTPLHGD